MVIDPSSAIGKAPSPEAHVPLVIVGAGPAGLAAALEAAALGVETMLVDENPIAAKMMALDVPLHFGQRGSVSGSKNRAIEQLLEAKPRLAEAYELGVTVQLGISAWGVYVNGESVHSLTRPLIGLADETRSWMVSFDRLIVAAGARDLGIAFPGWEKPGVMGAQGAQRLIQTYNAFNGQRLLILGSGALAMRTAEVARAAGIALEGIVEVESEFHAEPSAAIVGVPRFARHAIARAIGAAEVEGAVLVPLDDAGKPVHRDAKTVACDTIVLAVGAVPTIEIVAAAGARTKFVPELGGHLPVLSEDGRTGIPEIYAVGDCTGVDDARSADPAIAEAEGIAAARAVARDLGFEAGEGPPRRKSTGEDQYALWRRWIEVQRRLGANDTVVCQCEEVTCGEILDVRPPRYLGWASKPMDRRNLSTLAAEGPINQDQVKRLTRAGMGPCQGRRCREQMQILLATETGVSPANVPLASYRAPVRPLPLNIVAVEDETEEVRSNWYAWFNIPSQWTPHWLPADGGAAAEAKLLVREAEVPKGASIVIVGGGVTGLSAGYWLAQAGHDVLVLEKGIVGWEASGRNGGGAAHSFSPLFAEEQRLWPMMDDLLGYPTEYRPGRVRAALTEQQLAYYTRMADLAVAQGFGWERLDNKGLRDLAPLCGENAIGGIRLKCGGQANPQRTVQAFAWALQDHGGRILQHTTVRGFRTKNGRVREVETDRGSFGCDLVIVAAGPQTAVLGRLLGIDIPLAYARLEQIVTEAVPLMPQPWVDGNGLYGRQTLRGNLAFGGGPHDWVLVEGMKAPPAPSTYVSRHIARRLLELFPNAGHARVIRSWAGIVENTPDGRPVIEHLRDPSNAIVASLSSVGFGLCPAVGHAIKQIAVDGGCSFADLSHFSLGRFADVTAGWREQRGWVPPRALVEESV